MAQKIIVNCRISNNECTGKGPHTFARDRSRLPEGFLPLRHIGIYAYRVSFLHRFVGWPLGVLEARECLEQLRALEHGVGIHVAQACAAIPGGVDTAADLARVNALLAAAP